MPSPITENRGAFYFGNTAPDAQRLAGLPREGSHFFQVPPGDNTTPWDRMFNKHPRLLQSPEDNPQQAVFMAGYLAHLQADILWIEEIFLTHFGMEADWPSFEDGLLWHNVLRAWMDFQTLDKLDAEIWQAMDELQITGWLPFLSDENLNNWRDFLVEQLKPSGKVRTGEVFAQRLGIRLEEFVHLLEDEQRMNEELFSRLDPGKLDSFRRRLLEKSRVLIQRYLPQFEANG